ncbi:MAG: hypothetical protein QM680_00520 [Luteolibacter sp.]
MKFPILLLALASLLSLTSCNTSIGLWRDTKEGFIWTKNKIQNSRGGGGGDNSSYSGDYGAPIY